MIFEESMAEGLNTLLLAGHRLADLKTYTLRQLDAYLELAHQERRERQRLSAVGYRLAQHADKKGFQDFMRALEDNDR